MKNTKNMLILIFSIMTILLIFTGCAPKETTEPESLFNQSLNQELENLTQPEQGTDDFEPFFYNWSQRPEAEYEIAEHDVFTLTMGNFTSTEISFFSVMLGDSYEELLERLGIPDTIFMPADESYKNLEYRKKIGISGLESGLTFHLENNTVTRITVKPNFDKYLHGNTSIGTDKQTIYTVLDLPDYTSFVTSYRVLNYVEKGVEVYLRTNQVDRMSFTLPKEFKGVEYVTATKLVGEGVLVNTTEPVLIE